jgi:hypothetical protein
MCRARHGQGSKDETGEDEGLKSDEECSREEVNAKITDAAGTTSPTSSSMYK